MELILAGGLVVLFLMILRLRERVGQLEWRLRERPKSYDRSEPVVPQTAVPESAESVPVSESWQGAAVLAAPLVMPTEPALSYTPAMYAAMATPPVPPAEFFLYTWFKEQTLIKVGALIFFLGAAWFVSYAISQGWLPVAVRIMLGLLVAGIIYAVGVWRQRIEVGQYIVLTALGTAIVLVTVFCAQFLFNLFPAVMALGIIVASIAYTVFASVQTKTEWLAIVAALAGLAAPFLIGPTTPDPLLFMLYLLALAVSFSGVVFFTNWRLLSLVLVGGVSYFELLAIHQMGDGLLWFFMILFAGLFLTTTTVSLFRSAVPEPADIALLAIVGVVYTYGAHTLSLFPALALFVAAFLLAGIGYTLAGMQTSKRVVAVYVCAASAAWLIGTSLLLSGFTELLALTIEITLAFFVLTELRLSARAIYLSTATFLIPLSAALPLLFSPAWRTGIWHLDALAVVAVAVALLGSVLWVVERPVLRMEAWSRPVTSALGTAGFLYTLVVLAKIAESGVGTGAVFTYILWAGFIFTCLYYALYARLSDTAVTTFFSALMLPLAASLKSLTLPIWSNSVTHPGAIGVYAMVAFLALTAVLLSVYYRQTQSAYFKTLTIIASGGTILYSFMVIAVFWNGLFTPNISVVLIYSSYALLLYALASFCWHLRSPFPFVYVVTGAGVLPLVLSLQSMDVVRWHYSIIQPHAAGLYVMTSLLVVSAIRFLTYRSADTVTATRTKLWGTTLLAMAGGYAVALVWLISHVLSVSDSMAVTIALFVYTVAGLGLYVAGSSRGMLALKYAGMTLLALVVLRLGIVEVWVMDILWRIVTFLGIGLLFMLAALLEKKKS